ncbi:zinc transporter [Malonomonas rubra DSM 5091]|uniref:Zinc transporter n=1 Tax=Malonomonas rubra DSM 5091 TaxID=1122189 RepID=A0A1M6KR37_MALRU|nr:zinc transporter ZntB [Malonomonas rubra]SHJ61419.1 zinc transporter [Malonomonas rubra DSM 5091]
MESALISGFLLNGEGGGKEVDWAEIHNWSADQGLLWLHLDLKLEKTQQWLEGESGLDPLALEALQAEDTRPRCLSYPNGLLVILRGVNLNPGADPDDMISLRVWLEPKRIISIRHRKVMAVDDIRKNVLEGDAPIDAGDFLFRLTQGLAYRIGDVLSQIDDEVDALEDEVLEQGSFEQRRKLSNLRRQIIRIRRYLAPQREVMTRLQTEKSPVITELNRIQLREIADHITRYVEDLDSAKDRAAVCQEELENRIGAQMNKTLYILSIITATFLPLGLITGLLGINVGGIPGSENPLAFVFVCLLLLAIVVGQVFIFKRVHWV